MTPGRLAGRGFPLWPVPILCAAAVLGATSPQQVAAPTFVRPIDPRGIALPSESASAGDSRFSFIAYGDSRGPADGRLLQPQHSEVVDQILNTIPEQRQAGFPVRFVVQSGDAVQDGRVGEQWNVSFTPIINRLISGGRVPFLFVVGNHDVDFGNGGRRPVGDPDRHLGLRNTAAAMSQLWPPDGSNRRLSGYPTFAFGYGPYFFLAIDSNISFDDTQFTWVTRQLEGLDRTRFPNIVAVFHHPVLTTGRHGGPEVELQSETMRRKYLPLFRRHHVRLTVTGHDHLFDHFVEHYDDESGAHRMDHIVSGGGGAPVYVYRGEQDLALFAETAAPQKIRVEHLVRPGSSEAENPHHFTVFEVEGNRMWVKVVATVAMPFRPYGQPRVELSNQAVTPSHPR